MTTPNPKLGNWAIHYQEPYRTDAGNPRMPMPLRIAWLAYANHRANGHANFAKEEIAKVMGRFNDEGTFVNADRRTVSRAIRQAIDWELLDQGSVALCLIVPKHRVTGGPGAANTPCKRRHPQPAEAAHLRAVS